jgi:hypothetical protein
MRAASPEQRRLFGRRLRERREDELGYPARKGGRRAFEDVTGWDQRNAFDIENAVRSNFKEETLRQAARVYGVARESMLAFLRGEADELVPAAAAPAAPPVASEHGIPDGLRLMDRDREAAVRPLFDAILDRLLDVADRTGVPVKDVGGARLFGAGTPDAKDWDDERTRRLFSVRERVWMIAEMRVREGSPDRRAAGSALRPPVINVRDIPC